MRFSWGLLLESELSVENWLGRLGAIVSNMFFYWSFGIPSFIIIYLTYIYGLALLKQQSVDRFLPTLKRSLLTMAVLSIFFAFVFKRFDFPWGGTFGNSVNFWMTNFLGNIGMMLLFVFTAIGLITWAFNPDWQQVTVGGSKSSLLDYLRSLFATTQPQAKPEVADNEKQQEDLEDQPLPATKTKRQGSLAMDIIGEPETLELSNEEPLPRNRTFSDDLEIITPQQETLDFEEEVAEEGLIPPTDHNYRPLDHATIEEGIDDISARLINAQGLYDPTLELSDYEYPDLSLLNDYSDQKVETDRAELENNKDQIINTLRDYKIEITKIRATVGPTVTLYEIVPAPGVRISKIKNLEDDIALNLAALGIRIIAPIPGRGTIGIEVPNKNKQMVSIKEVFLSEKFKKTTMDLPIALGKTISNEVFVADLTKMPHLLIAGATGQGKSVGINTILMSLLFKQKIK